MKLSNSESANDDDGNDEEDKEDDEEDEELDNLDCRRETAGSNDDAGRFSREHGRFVLAPATHGKNLFAKPSELIISVNHQCYTLWCNAKTLVSWKCSE
jgi:hypothetical protein